MTVIHANPPKCCDLCQDPITTEFSDVNIPTYNMWGNLDAKCVSAHGCSYGTGLGQRYQRNDAGQFVKVEG